MESELMKFRRKKELESKKEEIRTKVKGYWDTFFTNLYQALLPQAPSPEDDDAPEEDQEEENKTNKRTTSPQSEEEPNGDWRLKYLYLGLMILTWLLFYVAFLKIGFGAVYFAISALLFIYYNTKTSRRKKGEISAYSVFNKDCQSIDGTLKSEHLEKQLMYRS